MIDAKAQAELLWAVVRVADAVLEPEPGVSVSEETLRALADRVKAERERASIYEGNQVGDEAQMVVRAVHMVALHRADGNEERALRWSYIARSILGFVRTDWARALQAEGAGRT